MKARKAKKKERPLFDSIRKPVAPSSKKFGQDRQDDRKYPTLRKTKHKKKAVIEKLDGDI